MRYTETKLKIALHLTEDLENTVNRSIMMKLKKNQRFTSVSKYLVNGAGGQLEWLQVFHHIMEIINGTIAYINNKDITISQLMKHVLGQIFQLEE